MKHSFENITLLLFYSKSFVSKPKSCCLWDMTISQGGKLECFGSQIHTREKFQAARYVIAGH